MKIDIRKIWFGSYELMTKHPVIILPFVFIAFLEGIALEISLFCTRTPISFAVNPIIKKFFGEEFLHYPANLILLPRIFYFLQIAIYISAGVFLTAITVNILKNIREKLPIKTNALIKNALGRYFSFFMYGIMMMALIMFIQKGETFIFGKFVRLAIKYIPSLSQAFYGGLFLICLFLSNIILQTFFVLTVPIIVLEKKPFLKALFASIRFGVRNFFRVFMLIFLPFLAYLPVIVLKNDPARLIDKLFPEVTALVVAAGIAVSLFADCFIIICASQFLTEIEIEKR